MYFKQDENFVGRRVNEMHVHVYFDWQICDGYDIIYANDHVLLGWQEVPMS